MSFRQRLYFYRYQRFALGGKTVNVDQNKLTFIFGNCVFCVPNFVNRNQITYDFREYIGIMDSEGSRLSVWPELYYIERKR